MEVFLLESSPLPKLLSILSDNIGVKSRFRAYFLFAVTHGSQAVRIKITSPEILEAD